MTSNDRQVNSSPGIPVLEKVGLARWAAYDLAIFGLPLIAAIVALSFAHGPWRLLSIVPVVFLLWLISFFRNPPRSIPENGNVIVAPADGTVADITPMPNYDFLGVPAVRIGIFLSIFNVHINRAPISGRVLGLHYQPGKFLNAMSPKSADENEYMWIGMERVGGTPTRFAVRQISGLLARKIVCTLQVGQTVSRGEKFGMIKLGSRTELILPADAAEVTVKVGDKLRAGSDVVAVWK